MPSVIEFGRLGDETDTGLDEDAPPDAEPVSRPLSIVGVPAADDEAETNERFETIERHLTILEAEFGPSSPPEPMTSPVGLFGEDFLEDEVVIDRYASLDAGGTHQRQHVFCHEGDVLARLLHQAAPQNERLEIVVPQPEPAVAETYEQPAAVVGTAPSVQPAVEPLRVTPRETSTIAAEAAPPPLPPIVDLPPPAVQPAEPAADESDADLVVVEEDPKVLPVTMRRPPVRREEYRNLFAKLRRG
jgi:hypothetical protein